VISRPSQISGEDAADLTELLFEGKRAEEMKKVVALLPEGKLFEQVFAEGIAPALQESGWSATRLSTALSLPSNLDALAHAFGDAELAIADLSGNNPNVMYQVGYAYAKGVKVLFIAQHLEGFPFDKNKQPVIAYAGDRAFLKDELRAFLASGTVSTHEQSRAESSNAREKFALIFGDILSAHGYEHRGEIQLENPTTFVLLNQDMELALVQDLARRARELGIRLKLM
jgi:hypothetical protein